jgi:hypothetical protein
MPQPPSKPPRVMDYASPAVRRRPAGRLLVWLMPLWCLVIILAAHVLGLRDDPFWFAAMILPLLAAVRSAVLREWSLALYGVAIALLVLGVGVMLPSLNRAR